MDPIPAGGTIEYVIEVANNGFDDAPVTQMRFAVPPSTTFTGFVAGLPLAIGECTPVPALTGTDVVCDVPALEGDGIASVTVQLLTSAATVVNFEATVDDVGGIDGNLGNNTEGESTTVTAGADLGITIDLPPTAPAGSRVPFTVAVENFGPNDSSGFTVQVPIPPGLVDIVAPPTCSLVGTTYSCVISSSLPVGTALELDFSGQIAVADGSDITATASVGAGSPPDGVAANNSVTESLLVTPGIDLTIDITRDTGANVLTGEEVTFTLSPSYTGDEPSDITVTHTVPPNFQIDAISAPGWMATQVGNELTFTRPAGSGPGTDVDLGAIVVETTAIAEGTAVSTVTIAGSGPPEQDLTNNTASITTTITDPVVDLAAVKTGPSPALGVVGNPYNFTISTRNVGNADFIGTVVMTDTLPVGLTLNSFSAGAWSCDTVPSGAALPTAGPIDLVCERIYTSTSPLLGGSSTSTVVVNATPTTDGVLRNTLNVASPDGNLPDENPANDTTGFDLGVGEPEASADLRIIKTATETVLPAGEVQTYDIEVVNDGPSPSFDISVVDVFANLANNRNSGVDPAYLGETLTPGTNATGLACGSVSAGGRSREMTCTIAELQPCTAGVDCPIIEVQVRHGTNASTINNTASVISNLTPDPDLTNNSSSTSFDQTPVVDITVEKTVSSASVSAGQDVTFVVAASTVNTGLSSAENLEITDTLPAGMRFVSAGPQTGSCSATPVAGAIIESGVNDQVVCNLGTVPNGQQRTVTIILQPTNAQVGDTLVNTADVSTTTPENDVEPNTATAETTVLIPMTDLSVSKGDTVDPVTLGEDTVYEITVRNIGPSSSEDIVVTDTLPASLISFQSVTIDGPGTCSIIPLAGTIGGTLVCEYPFLAAGDAFDIRVTMRGEQKGNVENVVLVSSFETENGFDPNPGNNRATEITTVRTRTDIGLPSKEPTAATVALEESFSFDIAVAVAAGAGLSEADDVVVSDTLPSNMVLTGPPTTAFPGSNCTGTAGATSFSCDLGTVPAGTTLTISVPVEVIATTSNPQTFTNTATVTTSSLDVTPGNNSASGSVDVVSSTLAGTVFRDFADDAVLNGIDTGVAGVTMTLEGTSAGGRAITRTTTTDGAGNYLFSNLPAGTYTVTRGAPSEPLLVEGTNTPGTEGGSVSGTNVIALIVLGDDIDATDYDFALIPQATVGIAKALTGQSVAADGSFTATFGLVVANLSLERLVDLSVTDVVAGASPRFGTLASPADPANDPLTPGSYAITSAPGGTCGGFQAGFDGSGASELATGFALDVGASCTLTFGIRVQPTDPLPTTLPSGGEYENRAEITGSGEESGQPVSDLSDDGTTPDTNGNRVADEPGENDPTPVPVSLLPSIALVKTAEASALSSPPLAGEIITYGFAVTNTGNVTLFDVTITDPLTGIVLSGDPIPSLSPGATDSTTFTATYAITQPDIDLGEVVNQATATGSPPAGPDVSDPSGTTVGDDTPTTTTLASGPGIALVKTAEISGLSDPPQVGDTITYGFAITNTGNVTLSNVTITEALPGVVLTGNPIAALDPGQTDTTTITGTYVLVEDDLTAGEVINTATATGNPPTGPPVDSPDTVTVPLPQIPGIELVKTITDESDLLDGAQAGDTISYSFTLRNTGNVPLRDVTVTDALPGVVLSGGPIALMNPAASGDGTDVDSTTYTAIYTLTSADTVGFAGITNTATATGTWGPPGAPLTVSDDSTVTAIPPDPSDGLTLVKTTPEEVVRRGIPVFYVIRLNNTNPFPTQPLDLVDTLPMGLVYVDGSAQVDGVPWPVTVSGQVVTFPDVVAPANTEVVATLNARLLSGTNPGIYTNSVLVLDPLFGVVAGPAEASVRLLPEAVFDCADVIGRVFDDLDGDGYQDAYDPHARPAEEEKLPIGSTENEVGLPGVRLVTLDGMVITTDTNGLFSVPCAALPADRGSNFLLSLDERTLPVGFEMTTENPRVMRLTPGMLTEMNFGARLAQSIRVDLAAAAFAHGPGISPALRDGISALVERLAEDPVGVDLVFHVASDAGPDRVAEARALMEMVADEIHRQWSQVGRGRLTVSRTIARLGE